MVILKDYFSAQSAHYARHRPLYPEPLFAFLASLAPSRKLALDLATGNGQAALGLTAHFDHIVATDISDNQLATAFRAPNIVYKKALAEDTGLPETSVDLITVAQGAHWFDFDRFYVEARRILKPDGVLAIWGYNIRVHIHPEVDARLREVYYRELFVLEPREIHEFLDKDYSTLPFPLPPLKTPDFYAVADYDYGDLVEYMKTLTCTKTFLTKHSEEELQDLFAPVQAVWPGEIATKHRVSWPLFLKVGRFNVVPASPPPSATNPSPRCE